MIVGDIRQEARQRMQGLWTTCVPIWFIYLVIVGAASGVLSTLVPFLGSLASVLIAGPMYMGITRIFLRVYKNEAIELGQLFEGFSEYGRTFSAYLLMMIYVILWSILLIIPGIIAAISYSMTFIIMAEDPNISASDAITKSKEMMRGYKWDFFRLQLSFIGWSIICVFTFGIGFLWLSSYMQESLTIFYHKIKGVGNEIPATGEETIIHQS